MIGLSTATWQYERRSHVDNGELVTRLQAHAAVGPRYGYRRLHTRVAREGIVANHKRVHRYIAKPACKSAVVVESVRRAVNASRCRRRAVPASAGRWTSCSTRSPIGEASGR